MSRLLATFLLCLGAAFSVTAQTATELDITAKLKARFPSAEVSHVRLSVIPGVYEAYIGNELIYVTPNVDYFFAGTLYDAKTMANLTEARTTDLFGMKWKDLPFEKAIKYVKGKGTRQVAVFSDADCPFCKRIEQTFATMDDITIYTFLMPIDSLHPDAGRKSKIIWCAKDKVNAWLDFMLRGKLVDGKGDCVNPVDELKALGSKHRVQATPTMILTDNRTLPGALPKEQLEAALNAALEKTQKKS
jgi:thiol:disulfide interchange protein DsbC